MYLHNISKKRILTLLAILFISGCATTNVYTPADTVDGIRSEFAQFHRISEITHNIFVANTPICSRIREEYGFTSLTLRKSATEEQKKLWVEAFNLKKQPTISYVVPKGAGNRAGLIAGDAIMSVNGNHWSEAPSPDAFKELLYEAQRSPQMSLGVRRGDQKQTLTLRADKACDYSFTLNMSDQHSGWASNRKVIIDLGTAMLLKQDDELAFIISHEFAHILLGHTLPEREKELGNHKMRSIIEKDADALGIRLMVRAGYDPKGAESALKSISLIDSGPLTNLFNYHGPYMPTDERIQYLRKIINH